MITSFEKYDNGTVRMGAMGCFIFFIVFFLVVIAFSASAALGWIFIFIIVIIGIAIFNFQHKQEESKKDGIRKKVSILKAKQNTLNNYKITEEITSCDLKYILSFDEDAQKINFASEHGNKTYSFRDILQSEIIQDGVSITKTSRGSQLGGALVGGVLFGGVGAVIGGLTGNTETEQKIKKIQLKIVVNDTKSPNYYILFLSNPDDSLEKSLLDYAKEKVNSWNDIMSILIKRADKYDR